MNASTAIIIATKGRPQELSNLLDALAGQTVAPELIVVSACDRHDVLPGELDARHVKVLFGPPGSSVQRNRALSEVRGKHDIVVFFDDDFVPSRFWIEQVKALFAARPDVVCATGKVLTDGVTSGGIDWQVGRSIVDKADVSGTTAISNYDVQSDHPPYGCNMAFRAKNIEHLTFDERLVLYGWLEDRDFSHRAGAKMVWTDAIWGVHLGTTRGRSSGLRFGYSQLVNPRYLVQKGTMTRLAAAQAIFRALSGNIFGSLLPFPQTDRRGRLKGNMIAIKDIFLARWAPEKASEL